MPPFQVKEFFMNRLVYATLLAVALLGFAALELAYAQKTDAKKDLKDPVVVLEDVKSKAPESWVREKPSNLLRKYQFRLPKVKDDSADAELSIQDTLGTIETNIKRRKAEFMPPEGKNIDDIFKVEKLKIGKATATVMDVQGIYLFKERPQAPDSTAVQKPDYRMIAVILDTKEGSSFIRLVGPEKTVAHHKKGFDEWLKAFK
jgi:hypothetical protein